MKLPSLSFLGLIKRHKTGEIGSLLVIGLFAVTALVVTVVSNLVSSGNQDIRQRAAGTDPYCIQENDWCGPGSSTVGCCGDLICRNQTCQPPIIHSPTPESQRSCSGNVAHGAKACDTFRSFVTCQDGTFSQPTQCPGSQICQNGNCVEAELQDCAGGVPHGGTACDSNRSFVTCNNGLFSAPTTCSNNQLCQNGSCVGQSAQSCAGGVASGDSACDTNRSYVVCNNGMFSASIACPVNQLCQGGKCVADPNAVPTFTPTKVPSPTLTPRPTATPAPTQLSSCSTPCFDTRGCTCPSGCNSTFVSSYGASCGVKSSPTPTPTRTPTPGLGGNVRCLTNRDCQVGYFCNSNTERCQLAVTPTSTTAPKPTATKAFSTTLSSCSEPCFDASGCKCPATCLNSTVSQYSGNCGGPKFSPTPKLTTVPTVTKKPSTTLLSCSQPCFDNNGCNCPSFCNKSVVTQYSDSCGGEKKVSPTVTKTVDLICETGNGVYECQGNVQTYCIGLGLPLVTTDCAARGCNLRTGKCFAECPAHTCVGGKWCGADGKISPLECNKGNNCGAVLDGACSPDGRRCVNGNLYSGASQGCATLQSPTPGPKQCEGGDYYQCSGNVQQHCLVGGGSEDIVCPKGCDPISGKCKRECAPNSCTADNFWCGPNGIKGDIPCNTGVKCTDSIAEFECLGTQARCVNGRPVYDESCADEYGTSDATKKRCLIPDSASYANHNICVAGFKCIDGKFLEGHGCVSDEKKLPNSNYCVNSLQCQSGYCEKDLFTGVSTCKTRPVSKASGSCYYGAVSCTAFGRYAATGCSCGTSYSACCGEKIDEKDIICQAGKVTCENNIVSICSSTGTSLTERSCSYGYQCQGQACAPTAVNSSCTCSGMTTDIYGNTKGVTTQVGESVIGTDGACYQCLPSTSGCTFFPACGSVPLASNDGATKDAIDKLATEYPTTTILLSNNSEASAAKLNTFNKYLSLLPTSIIDGKTIIISGPESGGGVMVSGENVVVVGQNCWEYHQNDNVLCGYEQSILVHELLHSVCTGYSTSSTCQKTMKNFLTASSQDGIKFTSETREVSEYVGTNEDFLLYSEYPTSPTEGFAISGAAYVLAPDQLKANQPQVYEFFKNEVFETREYIEIFNDDCKTTFMDIKNASSLNLQQSRAALCARG